MVFQPKSLDFEVSPCTGLTRESWIEAGEYLLSGVFQNLKSFQDPIIMPRKETQITYPHLKASKEVQDTQRRAEILEGLTRTFFIAAPLVHDNPQLTIHGFDVRAYYKNQILRVCTKEDSIYVGDYEDLKNIAKNDSSFQVFQQTVETCALVICLWECKTEIWDCYTKKEKDCIANFISSFAHSSTVPQNWRLFNMLDLAFLYKEGYPIDQDIMRDHAQAILQYSVGDGWYRDGHSFDYYSCWAFNVYAPLWNLWYGYEHEPYLAKKFEENSNKLMETYPEFFDQDGFTNMWGRSNIYRNATTSTFAANFFLEKHNILPGLARRISSGSLLQFFKREDFLFKGIPTLGFYGQFSPLVQGYSCAESPYWLGKAFLCLHFPKNHPFWIEKESNGIWEQLHDFEIKETTLPGPALCYTNHQANGETILRTGKVLKKHEDTHGMWNYAKLNYNTKFPWESTPIYSDDYQNLKAGELEAQQYVLQDITTGRLQRGNATFWSHNSNSVLYRKQFFNYNLEQEAHWIQAMYLADFAVPYGIVRVDKHCLYRRPVSITLGSYGFPNNNTTIRKLEHGGAKAIIVKGYDFTGREKQMAMTIYDGWEELSHVKSKGTNPDSENSLILYAKSTFQKQYGGDEPYVMISQVITKEEHIDFSEEEIFPIRLIEYEDTKEKGAYGNITIHFKNQKVYTINYEDVGKHLQL